MTQSERPALFLCPCCLAGKRAQRVTHSRAHRWFECRVHGAVLTDEFVAYVLNPMR